MTDKVPRFGAGPDVESLSQRQAKMKLEEYRAKTLVGDDAMYDSERGLFYFHGKHASLVGVEAVIAVNLPSLLMALSVVLQNTVVPILTGQIAVKPRTPAK